MRPLIGRCYTLRQILGDMELTDIPNLSVGEGFVVQNSHLSYEDMLSVLSTDDNDNNMFADTTWRYIRTTHEEIPCFEAINSKDVERFLDIDGMWVTPKGFPREDPERMDFADLLFPVTRVEVVYTHWWNAQTNGAACGSMVADENGHIHLDESWKVDCPACKALIDEEIPF